MNKNFFAGFEKAAVLREETKLEPHQQRVLGKLQKTPGLLLYHGLGSGKTLSAIAATQDKETDVVVPAALRQNFAKEVAKHTTGYSPRVMSYEKATKTPDTREALIVDEAHMMGDNTTKRTQSLIKKAPLYQRRILLTGTPIKNKPHEIGSLMRVVRGDKEIPADEKEFREKFIGEEKVSPGFWARMHGATPGVREVLKNESVFRKAVAGHVDYHEPTKEHFPSVSHEVIQTPMHDEQLKYYKFVLDKAGPILSYKIKHNLPPSKQESTQLNAFLQGARQVSNTPASMGGKDISPKFDTAHDRLKEKHDKDPNFRGLVYSNYLHAGVYPYADRLKKSGISHRIFHGGLNDKERKQMVDDYNEGRAKVLLISGAGAQGLDLKGTKLIQIMEPHWNDTKLEQAVGRGIRYKSHSHLPAEERHVHVERYQSTVPRGFLDRMMGSEETSTDQYLDTLSKQKQALNDQFLKVLKEEGSKT